MMKPYMGYSEEAGSGEGAVLIFAHNLKEARRIGIPTIMSLFTDMFTDVKVRLIKDGDYLFNQVPQWSKDKIASDTPHVVDSPPACNKCEFWGVGEFNEEGYCPDCAESIEDDWEYDELLKE